MSVGLLVLRVVAAAFSIDSWPICPRNSVSIFLLRKKTAFWLTRGKNCESPHNSERHLDQNGSLSALAAPREPMPADGRMGRNCFWSKDSEFQCTRRETRSAHPNFVLVRGRITPIAVVAGLVIMILALVYAALNRSHALAPKTPPIHQTR